MEDLNMEESRELPPHFKCWLDFYNELERKSLLDKGIVQLEIALKGGGVKRYRWPVDYLKARAFDELYPQLPAVADLVALRKEFFAQSPYLSEDCFAVINKLFAISRRPNQT